MANFLDRQIRLRYALATVLLVSFLFCASLSYVISSSSPDTLEWGSFAKGYSVIVLKEGSTYYSFDGTSGAKIESGTSASQIINNADDATNGGTIFLKSAIYEIDAPINKNPFNSLIGEVKSEQTTYTSLTASSSFPDGEFIIRQETDSVCASCGSIENLFLYTAWGSTKKVGGILLNSTGWAGAGGGIQFGVTVNNIRMQMMYQGLYVEGYVIFSYFNIMHIELNRFIDSDVAVVFTQGVPATAEYDNVPNYNWLSFGSAGGSSDHPANNLMRLTGVNDTPCFNKIEITGMSWGYYSHSALYCEGDWNDFYFKVLDLLPVQIDGWIGRTIYLHGGHGNPVGAEGNVIRGNIDATGQFNVVMDGGASNNYLEYIPWSALKINATGAGTGNVINILSQGDLGVQGGTYDYMWRGTPSTVRFMGWAFQDSGVATGTSPIIVTHHLVATPNIVTLGVSSTNASITASWASNATHITIYHNDVGSQTVTWIAEHQPQVTSEDF